MKIVITIVHKDNSNVTVTAGPMTMIAGFLAGFRNVQWKEIRSIYIERN